MHSFKWEKTALKQKNVVNALKIGFLNALTEFQRHHINFIIDLVQKMYQMSWLIAC